MEHPKPKKEVSPNAAFSNSMTTISNSLVTYFRPNNYRRQIAVKEKANSTLEKAEIYYLTSTSSGTFSINQHTKLLSIKNYLPNVTIQYGKHTLTAIYRQNIIYGVKEVYEFKGTIPERQAKLKAKREEIRAKLDRALTKFSREMKIWLPFKQPIWARYEDFVKGDSFIDSIPAEVIIHDTHFKKVYPKGIEFIGGMNETPVVKLKNFITNQALVDFSPIIANEIALLRKDNIEVMADFSENIKLHLKVLKGIEGAFKKFDKRLSQKKLREFF